MLSECPQCGQKLRSRWTRCPRCRQLLPTDNGASSVAGDRGEPAPGSRTKWVARGIAVIAVAIVLYGLSPTASPVPAAPAGAAPVSAVGEPRTHASGPGRQPASAAAAAFVAVDSKRAATAAYAQGNFATALEQLQAAVAAAPNDSEARNNLAQLLVRLGRTTDALPHFDEAVRLDPRRWSYRFNRARAYGLLNRWEEAVAEYRVAAREFPEDHATTYNLGLALLRVRDYPAAVSALEQAVAAAPDEHTFLITLGTAYVGAAQPDRARATFERFVELAPNDPEAAKARALLQALAASQP